MRIVRQISTIISIASDFGFFWALVFIFEATRRRNKLLIRDMALIGILTPTINYSLKTVFKSPRPSPSLTPTFKLKRIPKSYSFPSGHAAASVASARVLSKRTGSNIHYLFATIICLSRPITNEHTISDVLGGAVEGLLIGEIVSRINN